MLSESPAGDSAGTDYSTASAMCFYLPRLYMEKAIQNDNNN